MRTTIILLFLSTTFFAQSDTTRGIYIDLPLSNLIEFRALEVPLWGNSIQSDTNFIYDPPNIIVGDIGDIGDPVNSYTGLAKLGMQDTTKPDLRIPILQGSVGGIVQYSSWNSFRDTTPAFFLITSIDSAWTQINSPTITLDSLGWNGSLQVVSTVYIQPIYEKREFLNTKTIRGYIAYEAQGMSIGQEIYLDQDKHKFPKSTIVWMVKR